MTQPTPLKEQLKALEHLQELDLKIDQLTRNKGALPATLKTIDDSLAKLSATIVAKRTSLEEGEKQQRQTVAAQELNNDRIGRSSGRLEGVKNSQEFQAVNKEMEQLRKLNLTLQEQNKKSGDDLVALQKDIASLTEQLDKAKADRESQASVVSGETSKLDEQIGSLNGERKAFVAKVESRLLAQYNRVRGARAGLGIVPAVGGRCKGCNMVVPPQLYNMIQRGAELFDCPSCHRILFAPVSPGTSEGIGPKG